MVLICSKLQAAPFQGGFPVSRWVPYPLFANRSVVSWKNASSCGLNTIPRWSATLAAILAQHSRVLTDCPFQRMHHLPSDTPLKGNPTITCPMPLGRSNQEGPSLQRQAWKMTNRVIATWQRPRLHEDWRTSNEACSGSALSTRLPDSATTIWCSCMRGVGPFLPLLRSSWLCKRSGPGEVGLGSQQKSITRVN